LHTILLSKYSNHCQNSFAVTHLSYEQKTYAEGVSEQDAEEAIVYGPKR